MQRLARAVGLSLIAILASAVAGAAEGADFYAGKTLTIIAGLPPGGGVDGEMRVLAQYFSKYIPGHPLIVARNMPGASGFEGHRGGVCADYTHRQGGSAHRGC